jgi:hypothetical protein
VMRHKIARCGFRAKLAVSKKPESELCVAWCSVTKPKLIPVALTSVNSGNRKGMHAQSRTGLQVYERVHLLPSQKPEVSPPEGKVLSWIFAAFPGPAARRGGSVRYGLGCTRGCTRPKHVG